MLQVPIDKIVPLTAARDTLSKIIADVETGTPMYIFTKNGKPSVAVVSIDYLQKQMGPVQTVPPPSPPPPATEPLPPKIAFEPASPAEPDANFWGSFPNPNTPAQEPPPSIPGPEVKPGPVIDPKPVDTIKSSKQPAPASSVATPPTHTPPTINSPTNPNAPPSDPDDMDIG